MRHIRPKKTRQTVHQLTVPPAQISGKAGHENQSRPRVGKRCPQPTPMVLMLNVHHSRAANVVVPDPWRAAIPVHGYADGFGNPPAGRTHLWARGVVSDTGNPERTATGARQHPIEELPDDTLVFLLGSHYCGTERFSETASSLFGATPLGWERVQAICDYVHQHIVFACPCRAGDVKGICDIYREFAHFAVHFCRCMNIPARYCTVFRASSVCRLPPNGFLSLIRSLPGRRVAHRRRTPQSTRRLAPPGGFIGTTGPQLSIDRGQLCPKLTLLFENRPTGSIELLTVCMDLRAR